MNFLNMKAMNRVIAGGLLACMAMVVAAGPVAAAEADAPGAPADAPSAHGWQHHHGDTAAMFRGLGLTDAQRASMKSILEAARPGIKDLHQQMRANFKLLRQTTPDDGNYAQVVARVGQENGALTTQMINARSKVFSQCYSLLAPDQKIHLAELQAKRAKWMEEHKRSNDAMDGPETPPQPPG
jgi:periplasmic protein CpxP/Spy